MEARIISAADAYEAMTSDRPYRKAVGPEEALDEIERNAGAQLCPRGIEALLGIIAGPARLVG